MKTYTIEELSVGMSASYERTISEGDVLVYAGVTGDVNPVHLDAAFAATTPFKTRIAHGMLSAGFMSNVLGTKLPGPGAIYLSQSMKFKAPVHIGETVVTTCTVKEINTERRRVTLSTVCAVGETVVVEGEAVVMVQAGAITGTAV